jgi:DNA-binding transcriptional LysR family regulator
VVPLCSPDYLRRLGAIDDAANLRSHTLIHPAATTMDWKDYGARVGLDCRRPGKSLTFSDSALVLQAALIGQGVALGWLSSASAALRDGLLVPASKRPVRTGREYRLVAKVGAVREEVTRVREWFAGQVRDDIAKLARQYEFF